MIQTTDKVLLRNGKVYFVWETNNGLLDLRCLEQREEFDSNVIYVDNYNENLTHYKYSELDIMAVYEDGSPNFLFNKDLSFHNLKWKRPAEVEETDLFVTRNGEMFVCLKVNGHIQYHSLTPPEEENGRDYGFLEPHDYDKDLLTVNKQMLYYDIVEVYECGRFTDLLNPDLNAHTLKWKRDGF